MHFWLWALKNYKIIKKQTRAIFWIKLRQPCYGNRLDFFCQINDRHSVYKISILNATFPEIFYTNKEKWRLCSGLKWHLSIIKLLFTFTKIKCIILFKKIQNFLVSMTHYRTLSNRPYCFPPNIAPRRSNIIERSILILRLGVLNVWKICYFGKKMTHCLFH
jgi:hypothetical protein